MTEPPDHDKPVTKVTGDEEERTIQHDRSVPGYFDNVTTSYRAHVCISEDAHGRKEESILLNRVEAL